ncbi:uncharacterized protein LOC126750536 isoform X1 [Anthonomus grandis grandis]|uniref:uncharacterized protein LOC126750536 isoform X1 n=1 Tax=Anthonomus grandis grandis TaxID=2921223 RepID=UPI0021655792|nr:uncharacterized protein LOC126750536 isoform X1 [Anthonomus grandis grandis]
MQGDFPGGREVIRRALMKRSVSEAAIPIMISSISEGTLKQYSTCYKKFWSYCIGNNIDMFSYNLNTYLNFLLEEINKNLSYSSNNIYRSALNLIFSVDNKDEIIIKRFIKDTYNTIPPQPKYAITWSLDPVLKYLASLFPLENLSIDKLTIKLVTLMAITTAHRVQTLSKITLNNIFRSTDKIEIRISEKIKTSGPNKLQPTLVFPYFKEKLEICVATTIYFCIQKTSLQRGKINNIILTHKKPFHAASCQSISRWIKAGLKNSGINIERFSSHSVRHASTSSALRCGVNVNTIKNTAGWSLESEVFLKFYNRPVGEPNEIFANTILKLALEK